MTEPYPAQTNTPADRSGRESVRLHYIDWLRVLAILGVFLFHTMRPFGEIPWGIKNAEQSRLVTIFIIFFAPWGIPMFYFLSGAGSWFALRRRTGRQYAVERVQRLLIPFIVGSLLFSLIQLYIQWLHQSQTGAFVGTLWEFFLGRRVGLEPRLFGWVGLHLWFLGFLFAFSLIALPLFLWFKRDAGQRSIKWLARLGQRRGGLLLFVIPMVVIQFVLRPYFPADQGWTDFIYMLTFFIYGYILYADERFAPAVRRDWPFMLAMGLLSTLSILVGFGVAIGVVVEWMSSPGTPGFYLFWSVWSINSWCWTLFMLYIGMRYLDFTSKWLVYGRESIMPFYLLHHPVIVGIAYFVVQWETGIPVKVLVVVIASFLITLGLIELLIRPFKPMRRLFGMKPRRRKDEDNETALT